MRAQVQTPAPVVRLTVGDVSLNRDVAQWVDSCQQNTKQAATLVLLHATRKLEPAEQQQLRALDVDITEYISNNTYSAIITKDAKAGSISLFPIDGIAAYKPEWKIAPVVNRYATPHTIVVLMCQFYQRLSDSTIRSFVNSVGGSIQPSG
ncbi:MAG: hypothetical protein EBZ77_14945, partial [Chitinophagia bacterium]|nr:hypothetical protein [Chitinophagia bacterium]